MPSSELMFNYWFLVHEWKKNIMLLKFLKIMGQKLA